MARVYFRTCVSFMNQNIVPCRSLSLHSLTLDEARRELTNISIQHIGKRLGREINAFEYTKAKAVNEVHVQTCRILGTDQYIPFEQVRFCRAYKFSKHRLSEAGIEMNMKSFYFANSTVDTISNSPVEIDWRRMDPMFSNAITVGDVYNALPVDDQDTYGLDLLRFHMVAGHVGGITRPFYFTMEDFLDRSVDVKRTLTSFTSMAKHSYPGYMDGKANTDVDGKVTRVMTELKRELIILMDNHWAPGKAFYRISSAVDDMKELFLSGGRVMSKTMYETLRDMCVILNAMVPVTASKAWSLLHPAAPSDDSYQLDEQKWPIKERFEDLRWPVFINIHDTNRRHVTNRVHRMLGSQILDLTEEEMRKLALGSSTLQKRFGDLNSQVKEVSWKVNTLHGMAKMNIILYADETLTAKLIQLRR